ncbi:site-specific DNA-methyltransferase [Pseudomonas sp. S1_E04]
MDKLKMHSQNLTEANIDKLAALFPNCITEARDAAGELKKAIDFDLLRQELSSSIVEGPQERYQLNWPGKREALLTANAPIAKTLRPCREQSVEFDTTRNIIIEGDNLDALKLLQENYLGKVTMIYIDPPYNTGKEFIYSDNFSEGFDDYLVRSNQKDDASNRMTANPESNGRFHSDWLSMIYSRLKLARNLLDESGAVFISIDDNEISSLRKLCDEIFGEDNFIANFVWQKRYSRENRGAIGDAHEYIVCYARSAESFKDSCSKIPLNEEQEKIYKNPNNDPQGRWRGIPMTAQGFRPNQMYQVVSPSGITHTPPEGRCWSTIESEFKKLEAAGRIYYGKDGTAQPQVIRYLSEVEGLVPWTWLPHEDVGHTDEAKKEIYSILGKSIIFDTPKPTRLINHFLNIVSKRKDFLVLDFFAGSGTTAQSVMAMNAKDGGARRYILVQIQENCGAEGDAFKTIADIARERIRLAGKKIRGELLSGTIDIGFRALKVDCSNLKDVYYSPDNVSQDLLSDQVDNIREDRTAEDLLFQVLLDWGVDLTLPINQQDIAGKTVFFVDGSALVACFDTGIDEDFVKELAGHKPLRVVFRDAGFASDSVKINVEQMFKLLSPATEIKTL